MKYKHHLLASISPDYGPEPYLAYAELDYVIRQVSGRLAKQQEASADPSSRSISISAPPSRPEKMTDEVFLTKMDSELKKVEQFTLSEVRKLRTEIGSLEKTLEKADLTDRRNMGRIKATTDGLAEQFLTLEKYVNVNFMGFHKILKKHDKYVPDKPCKSHYVSRIHSQAWVRGDYSDVVVRLSAIYAAVRGDHTAEEDKGASQSFMRQTSKYWIKTEDVSAVKYAVLKNLPVFLQNTSTGESDSQLTNSVYLDNDQLELYHGRLDKQQGAIALRFRWYATGDPSLVFIERKTHRDKWTGESSVKERFIVPAKDVPKVMDGTYPIAEVKKAMLAKGKSQLEADEWEILVTEIMQAIQTKQLVPTMRTQCTRTAFQIPFDATVRVSLDTNLCMISERGYDIEGGRVWHRDSSKTISHTDITRFPHAILEVKLELGGESLEPPRWVQDLQNSGLLYEVHKFSKFTHGCAALLAQDVTAVPYWVDDISIRQSILDSGGGRILVRADLSERERKRLRNAGVGPGANMVYDHLLPFGDVLHDRREGAVGRTAGSRAASAGDVATPWNMGIADRTYSYGGIASDSIYDDVEGEATANTCASWLFPFCSGKNSQLGLDSTLAPTRFQKVEPKLLFANERVFIHWLHNGVMLYTIASGIFAYAVSMEQEWAVYYGLSLLPVALGFCVYALWTFLWRAERMRIRIPGRWDDPRAPLIIGGALLIILIVNFCAKVSAIARHDSFSVSDLLL